MNLTVYGSRGSSPCFSPNNVKYGGNTSCYRMDVADNILIFDCGSGLNGLLADLQGLPDVPLHILISHPHFDHISGLATFWPLFDECSNINIYGAFGGVKPEEWLLGAFKPPHWPIALSSIVQANFVEIQPGKSLDLPGNIGLSTIELNHPGSAIGFLIDADDRSFAYLLDNEMTKTQFSELVSFCRNVDAVVFDATYLPEDYASHQGWGHSTWQDGMKLAESSACGHLILSHFAPVYTDTVLDTIERITSGASIAHDGMKLKV